LGEPGRGLFEIDKLVESRRRGRLDYPCPQPGCDEWQSIDALLAVPAPMPALQVALAELQQGQAEIVRAQEAGFQSVHSELRRLISQADEQFAGLMAALTDEARDGPRLFSLAPVEPRRWGRPGWAGQRVRLTLWCEHSRLPLPALWGDPERGSYVFEWPREWLVRLAPYARLVSATLSLVLPVAGSAVKLALDEAAYKGIANGLDLSQKSFSALLGAGGKAGEWLMGDGEPGLPERADELTRLARPIELAREHGVLNVAHGGALRELHALLRERDPGLGGLKRVQNKRRAFLWIHPRFETEYYPEPPVIPAP